MNKKFVIISAVAVIVEVGGVWWYLSRTAGPERSSSSQKVTSYSFDATVPTLDSQTLRVTFGSIQSQGGKNTYVQTSKTVTLTIQTVYNHRNLTTKAQASDLKAGEYIVVYTSSDPSKSDPVSADRILITN